MNLAQYNTHAFIFLNSDFWSHLQSGNRVPLPPQQLPPLAGSPSVLVPAGTNHPALIKKCPTTQSYRVCHCLAA